MYYHFPRRTLQVRVGFADSEGPCLTSTQAMTALNMLGDETYQFKGMHYRLDGDQWMLAGAAVGYDELSDQAIAILIIAGSRSVQIVVQPCSTNHPNHNYHTPKELCEMLDNLVGHLTEISKR